jgi:hypothetical protein
LSTAIAETKTNVDQMGKLLTLNQPSYMAGYPTYVLNAANLPTSMYYRTGSGLDSLGIGGLVLNSWYTKSPSATPSGTTKVTWISNTSGTLSTAVLNHYATGFVTKRSELLPIPQDAITAYGSFASNMPQNPGY